MSPKHNSLLDSAALSHGPGKAEPRKELRRPPYFRPWLLGIVSLFLTLPCAANRPLLGQQYRASGNDSNAQPATPVSNLSLSETGKRYLMLHNGAVFRGEIQKMGDKWNVQLDEHTSLMMENYKVSVIADSLEDIYTYRNQRISQYDSRQRVELVRWCLQNELLDQAQKEFQGLEHLRIDPQVRQSLAYQIQQKVDPTPIPSAAAAIQAVAKKKPLTTRQAPIQMVQAPKETVQRTLPGADPLLTPAVMSQASQETLARQPQQTDMLLPVDSTSTASVNPLLPAGIDRASQMSAASDQSFPQQLPVASVFQVYDVPGAQNPPRIQSAIDQQLTDASVQQFGQSLHPVLIESCAGCHFEGNSSMEGKSQFQLRLVSAKNPADAIRFNLQQVLKLLNRENPGNSELLNISNMAHGGLKSAPIANETAEQQALVAWVYSTQIDPGTVDRTTEPMPESGVMLAGADMELPNSQGLRPAADGLRPASGATPLLLPAENTELSTYLTPKVNPANPFDPGAFNQQHAAGQPLQPAAVPAVPAAGLPPALSAPKSAGGTTTTLPSVAPAPMQNGTGLPGPSMFQPPTSPVGFKPIVPSGTP